MPFVSLLDPDVIWRQPEGWPEPGPDVGREAVMRQFDATSRDLGRRRDRNRSATSSTPATESS